MNAIQIGGLAKKVLIGGATGKVLGITSSGSFLNSAEKILFVTSAPYKSPYNIQINEYEQLAAKVKVGDQWQVSGEVLEFNESNMRIDMGSALFWSPLPQKIISTGCDEQIVRINQLMRRLRELDPHKGWLIIFNSEPQNKMGLHIRQLTKQFLAGIDNSDKSVYLKGARSILGLGGGLTPSGDDWLTGFFLFHARRAQAQNVNDPFLTDLGAEITNMAFESTTSISANRIEAACQGWAEEIFLEVIDHLFDAEFPLSDEKIVQLVNFGHSSGVDTCLGIHAACGIHFKNSKSTFI